ncbi:MAG: hypothetical protein ACREDG_00865 [Methylocella sp.]
MASGSIKARVERLEQAAGAQEANAMKAIIVSFVHVKDGKPAPSILEGMEIGDDFIPKPEAESEEAFRERISAAYRRPGEVILMFEMRIAASEGRVDG